MSDQPLSPQQVHALHALRAAGSTTTAQFIESNRSLSGAPYTDDQARNLLKRLEGRGHLAGDGHGRTRVWSYVSSPQLEIALGPPESPATPGADPSPEPAIRTYVVLERRPLDELVMEICETAGCDEVPDAVVEALREAESVFERVADPEARNTEHALRTAAKDAYGHVEEADPDMVAVASRMFQIVTVKVRNSQTVSLG